MKTKLQKLLTISLLVFCGSVSAANISQKIALWEQVDKLLCVGRSSLRCIGFDCAETNTGAVWNVDFSNMVINVAGSDYTIKLISSIFLDYSIGDASKSTFFMGDSRTFTFSHKSINQLADVISATTTEAHYISDDVSVNATHWDCYQQ